MSLGRTSIKVEAEPLALHQGGHLAANGIQ